MRQEEDLESCLQEIETWHDEVSKALNDAEKVAYEQAVRSFQATKYVYGNALKERDELVAYKKKHEDRLWIYLVALAAVIWGSNFLLEAFGRAKIESAPWILVGFLFLWWAYFIHFYSTLILHLNSRVIIFQRDLNALNVPDDVVRRLLKHDEFLSDGTIDHLEEDPRLKKIRFGHILDYQARSYILGSVTGHKSKMIPSCVYRHT